jgi:hypothetical protein
LDVVKIAFNIVQLFGQSLANATVDKVSAITDVSFRGEGS